MTNEQAKSELMQLYGMLSEEKKQALDVLMAQADGEYISKQMVKEKMQYYGFHASDMTITEFVEDNLPSVAIPQEKTGQWIERRSRVTGHIESVCSECGAEEGYPYNDYCGNCGTKMVER